MSRIEELIKEKCPNGVEYKRLKSVCTEVIVPMRDRPKIFDGEIPWCRIEDIEGKYFNDSLSGLKVSEEVIKEMNLKVFPTGTVICSCSASIGVYAINTQPLITNQTFIGLVCGDEIFNKFLLYYMETQTKTLLKLATTGTIPYISRNKFEDLEIPVPPIEVQQEIVRVLDKFTELEAGLQDELEARKKQYEYYHDELLKFDESVVYESLESLCDIVDYRGKTPKKVDSGVFLVTAKNIRKGYIDYESSQEFIAEEDYLEVMRRGLPQMGDVLFTTEAPCGNVAQIDREDIALAQRVIKYRPKGKKLNSTFLKYVLLGSEFQNKLLAKSTGGTVKGIKGSVLHTLTVPVPSIEEQLRIVEILDKFNEMCNDCTVGLSAEIAIRKKQYEYYRDTLLSFERFGE